MVGSAAPVFNKAEAETKVGALYTDPETLLKSQLPGVVELAEVVNELKIFEGAWHTCYPGLSAYELTHPIFNAQGDLLFKLRPFGMVSRTVTKTAVSTTTGTVTEGSASATGSVRRTSTSIVKTRPSLQTQRSRTSCKSLYFFIQ